jgi:hypothetical protein
VKQGGPKHGVAESFISANALKDWRSAKMAVSLPPMTVSPSAFASCTGVERVVSNTTRSGHL